MLVLSLFPGADLFGMAFEIEGFCVVRGPDILLGGNIRNWKCLPGYFDGVIGGPPCQFFSDAAMGQVSSQRNMIPEFERIVREACPKWYVMENVTQADNPDLPNCKKIAFDAWDVGCNQRRVRGFWSNLTLQIPFSMYKTNNPWPTVVASEHKYGGSGTDKRRAGRKVGRRMTIEEVNLAMGLPSDFYTPALTMEVGYQVRGNGVPIQMGRAIAKAVKEAIKE